MKNFNFITVHRLPYQLLILAAFSLLLFSCSKEEVPSNTNTDLSATVFEKSAVAASKKAAPAPGELSIADIAEDAGFTQLLLAITYVDGNLDTKLAETFSYGTDQYTVFAPNDEAFENLYNAFEIDGIDDLPATLVRDVLLYHVVEGRRAANSVVPPKKDRKIETLLGVDFKVDKYGNIQAVGNTATIIAPNISASNGIIHVIDTVILPIE